MPYLIIILLCNIISFIAFGLDKYFAKKDKKRISEKTLIAMAFLAGGLGAISGMVIFRHKTKKPLFRIMIPLALMANSLLFYKLIEIL